MIPAEENDLSKDMAAIQAEDEIEASSIAEMKGLILVFVIGLALGLILIS